MKRLALAILLAGASASPLTAQADMQRNQGSWITGSPITLSDGSRIILPAVQLRDVTGAALGTSANPLYVSGGGSGGGSSVPTGTAGNPNAAVVTVQGISGGTPQNVNNSQVAGNTIATGTGASNTGTQRVVLSSDSAVSATQGTTPWADNIAQVGGVAIATGAGAANTGTLRVVQSTDSIANDYGLVATAAPTLTSGNTAQLSLTTAGGLRVDGSGVLQPVVGNLAAATADSGAPVKIGCYASNAAPTNVTNGQRQNNWCTQAGGTVIAGAIRATAGDAFSNSQVGYGYTSDGSSALLASAPHLFNGTSWDRQRGDVTGIWQGGHSTIATGQVSVTTTATLVAAARTGRQKVIVTPTSANACYVGASGVTTTTGYPLAATAFVSQQLDTAAAVYMVCAATTTVGYLEQY